MEGLQRAETPTQEYPKVSSETLMGEGVALRGLRPRWRLRRPRHIGSSCDALELRAPCHARLLACSGAAAFGIGRPMNLPRCRLVLRPAPQAASSDHRTWCVWCAALHVGEIHRGAQARRRPHQDEDGRAAARRRRFRRPLVQVPFSYIC